MKCSSFLNLVFCERRFIAENWLCFRACNSRIVTYDQEFCFVVWLMCFNHLLRKKVFEKFSFKKSWCCRKHVFVFEIVSLKDLNNFFDCWVKRFVRHYGGKFENFSILGVNFFKKVKLLNFGGWLLRRTSQKVLMFSLFLDTS
jgi:hypothetical protein